MFDRLIHRYDMFIYWLAWKSIRRICLRSPGMSYLMELWIRRWNVNMQMSEELKRSTEVFFETQTGVRVFRPDEDTEEVTRRTE